GIPAVIAMLGDVYQETVHAFIPVFIHELLRDGQVDRAMSVARNAIRNRPDSWSPVLYTRVVDGRLWYPRGTGARAGATVDAWPVLLRQIRERRCVPILGSGLLEPYVGSARESARRLAKSVRYPLSPPLTDELTQVAQYLSTTISPREAL